MEPDDESQLDPVLVLIADDQDSNSVWDQRLDEDARRRRAQGSETRFKRYYQVCGTAATARSAVDTVLAGDVPLGLILLDNRLQVTARSHETQPEAVNLMCHIAASYRRRPGLAMPPCVLATVEPDVLLSHAFIQAGGRHSLARNVATHLLLDDLWRVVERGDRWRYAPKEPLLELTDQQKFILPYLYAGLAPAEIVRRVNLSNELDGPKNEAWVYDRTSGIRLRANELVRTLNDRSPEEDPIPEFVQGESRRLAQFALDHGNIWIDFPYREILAKR